jgi:hypothetical protein
MKQHPKICQQNMRTVEYPFLEPKKDEDIIRELF